MQGQMNVVPLMGTFTEWFPLMILIISFLTLTKLLTHFMKCLGLDPKMVEGEDTDSALSAGKRIVDRERQRRGDARGGRIGDGDYNIELGQIKIAK